MQIKTENLTKKYGSRVVVSDLNLSIKPGQILGLLGPNGAGKSTAIKMLTGQTLPSSGKIIVDGKSYNHIPKEIRNLIGVMPQEVIIWEDLTIEENLKFSATLQNMNSLEIKKQVEFIIEGLSLQKERHTLAKNLSGGYKRRVNLANSIIHNPSVVFLDEPTPGVDPQTRRFLWDFIKNLKTTDRAVVLTDHYLEEAEKLSDYVVIIDDGQLIAEGTVSDLKHKYGEGSSIEVKFDIDVLENQIELIYKNLQPKYTKVSNLNNSISILDKDGIKVIKEVSAYLDSIDVNALTISLREPTLEDVFLILTGKNIRE